MLSLSVDRRMRNKIESLMEWENDVCSIMFKDLNDTFWFNSKNDLQEFIRKQEVERFFDKSLRKGYFDYKNENNDLIRYEVSSVRGKLTVLNENIIKQ